MIFDERGNLSMTRGKRARKYNVTPKHAVAKKKWVDMEMYRVQLDETQAVLSCCSTPTKVVFRVTWEGSTRQSQGGDAVGRVYKAPHS